MTKIERVRYGVQDLDASTDEFVRLGFMTERHQGSVEVQVGATRVELHEVNIARATLHLAWRVPPGSFDAAAKWIGRHVRLLERDGKTEFAFDRLWRARSAYWRDDNGDVLEIIEHPPVSSSSGQFDAGMVLGVDEVGIAVEDIDKDVPAIEDSLGVRRLGGASRSFVPVGDDEGKLIVVSSGRAWFPTSATAEVAPIEVALVTGTVGEWHGPSGVIIRSR